MRERDGKHNMLNYIKYLGVLKEYEDVTKLGA